LSTEVEETVDEWVPGLLGKFFSDRIIELRQGWEDVGQIQEKYLQAN